MKKHLVLAPIAMIAAALCILSTATAGHAQNLSRFASEFLNFDGSEQHAGPGDTPVADNGVSIFEDHVTVPANVNVLYVTIAATGDTSNSGVESQFTCVLDGVACNAGATHDATAAGWIVLEEGLGSQDDNAITYTWCTPVKPLSKTGGKPLVHDVQLRMASNGAGTAFIEGVHVFVDGNRVKNASQACAEGHN